VLQATLDLSARMGIDAPSAAHTLARAIADPTLGLRALRAANITFTESQIASIKAMHQMGDEAGVEAAILGNVRGVAGGAAEAFAQTLPGALSSFGMRSRRRLMRSGRLVRPMSSPRFRKA